MSEVAEIWCGCHHWVFALLQHFSILKREWKMDPNHKSGALSSTRMADKRIHHILSFQVLTHLSITLSWLHPPVSLRERCRIPTCVLQFVRGLFLDTSFDLQGGWSFGGNWLIQPCCAHSAGNGISISRVRGDAYKLVLVDATQFWARLSL